MLSQRPRTPSPRLSRHARSRWCGQRRASQALAPNRPSTSATWPPPPQHSSVPIFEFPLVSGSQSSARNGRTRSASTTSFASSSVVPISNTAAFSRRTRATEPSSTAWKRSPLRRLRPSALHSELPRVTHVHECFSGISKLLLARYQIYLFMLYFISRVY